MPTLQVTASHDLVIPTPIHVSLNGVPLPAGVYELTPENGGASFLAQGNGEKIVALLSGLKAAETVNYTIAPAQSVATGVTLETTPDTLQLSLPEGPLGTYCFGPGVARPYIAPLLGPGGQRVTRGVPPQEGEKDDHPHHTSLWTAYDEVNDVNNWHNAPGHGYTRHVEFLETAEGPVYGGFTAQGLWTDKDGVPILTETRRVRLYNAGPDVRLFDYEVYLSATHGLVEIRDTKEAGIIAIRVATTMDGERGGVIENSEGGRGESQCWGKRAAWCDYSGEAGGAVFGIAMLSHPDNSQGNPRWHARDYGLCSTNPFATAAFGAGEATPFILGANENLTFRYRVLVHRGGASEGGVAGVYAGYAEPPAAVLRS